MRIALALALVVAASSTYAEEVKRDIRGIRVGMDFDEAVGILKKQGATCADMRKVGSRSWTGVRCDFEKDTYLYVARPFENRFKFVSVIDYEFPGPQDYDSKRKFEKDVINLYGLRETSSGHYIASDGTEVMISLLDPASIFFSNPTLRARLENPPRTDKFVPPKF